MKVLICGAGLVTAELLKRLGKKWQVTLVEKDQAKTGLCLQGCDMVVKTLFEDASSPLALEAAGIAEQEYVLALTDRDDVNLAVVRLAREAGVAHVLALVHASSRVDVFETLGARVVQVGSLPARHIYHYLEDPRIAVTPLATGRGEVLEIDTSVYFRMIGKPALSIRGEGWRLAALFRNGKFQLPEFGTRVEAGDRMVIVGDAGSFQPVCSLLECDSPHFPLAYGRGVLVALIPDCETQDAVLDEALYVARYTKVSHMSVVCTEDLCNVEKRIKELSHVFEKHPEMNTEGVLRRVREVVEEGSVGCVVVPPFETALWNRLLKPPLVGLAHSLGCPVLFSRGSEPYSKILVPFNNNPVAELTLELALDFAKQVQADVTVIIVEEEDFVHGEDWMLSAEDMTTRIKEISHVHKVKIDVMVCKGNPVKEVISVAKGYDLLVVSSSTDHKDLFFPHVGEMLTAGVSCSVLVVTS
ncbi:NAD-binding protein [Desulfovibrio mangrovi]|uniref:NAD-binding protein n=1 Tax=Desulfovibrio mangrovi TaxID=2976983 RepID=UPI002245ACE4|nr:NAD-binding protein [Desulfovibrio mangrovi]UZP68233.1 NAD-binding protein [Desulfovibrio mangrovi]